MASPARADNPNKPTTTSSGSGSGGSGSSSGSGKGHESAPPSSSKLIHEGVVGPTTGTTPLSAIMDASLLPPGYAAVTASALSWHGTDASEVDVPVVGVAVGVAPRLQIAASIPYTVGNDTAGVAGGWGTTYLSAKIGLVQNDEAGDARLFASGGYFSGGIGFAGGGIGVQASSRAMLSGSFSHAWSSGTSTPV